MSMSCPACGKRFRSMSAEAYHRHNFPILCKRNRQFQEWEKEVAKMKEESHEVRSLDE